MKKYSPAKAILEFRITLRRLGIECFIDNSYRDFIKKYGVGGV